MKLKTYQAVNMSEALAQVRRELGREAVILHTRSFKKGGVLGLGGRRMVEITASADVNVLPPGARSRPDVRRDGGPPPSEGAAPSAESARLHQELDLVKQMVCELVQEQRRSQHPNVPEELFSMYLSLINQEVAQELADGIIRQVASELTPDQLTDDQLVRHAVARCVEQMVPTDTPPAAPAQTGKPRVVAFVGPTGVGKTTTIAKLAANYKLREGKAVALITIDTYRIAAVDQLRTYANIINVPLHVVLSPAELRDALARMRQFDLILIDTAGRSQNDAIKLQELKSFLDAADPDEVHLVLSSTASHANLQMNIERFSTLGVDKVVFTKLDEAVGVGMLLNVVRKLDRSISYLTAGQNVPDDIEPGSGQRLARLILQQCAPVPTQSGDRSKEARQESVSSPSGAC